MVYRSGWTEAEEIEFISGIGTFSKLKLSRTELLRRYRQALRLRVNWDGIDKGRVLFAAKVVR